jgi:hypothetical protein
MKRIKLPFTPGLEVEFVDRDRGLKQIRDFAERGTRLPIVVYGPEGCGKTAWLKQSTEILRELGFETLYINPLHRDIIPYTSVKEVAERLLETASEALGATQFKLATLVGLAIRELLSKLRGKIAVLVDDVFQAIGLDKAEVYVKELLGLIEYPPESYERMVVLVATSEGVTRWRIGRHRWASLMPMWNMSREGFEELYESIPTPKPPLEDAWRYTGGNPGALSRLIQFKWDLSIVTKSLIEEEKLTPLFINKWRSWLEEAVEDPDILWSPSAPEELINELEARNLIVYFLRDRDLELWIDKPPPERDLELGIGKRVAWQTPLHREAVRRALIEFKT